MSDPKVHETRPAAGGTLEHLGELFAALLGYVQARLQLAGIESKEAAIHYGILLALVAGAVFLAFFAYIFLCIGVVFAIAYFFREPSVWIWIMLGLGAAHLGVAIVFVLIARAKVFVPMFQETLGELRKDQIWLSRQKADKKRN